MHYGTAQLHVDVTATVDMVAAVSDLNFNFPDDVYLRIAAIYLIELACVS